jgi:hypothetical protein
MVGLQVIDLFLEEEGPEVFAQEFDTVEVGLRSWFAGGESGWQMLEIVWGGD